MSEANILKYIFFIISDVLLKRFRLLQILLTVGHVLHCFDNTNCLTFIDFYETWTEAYLQDQGRASKETV